MLPMKTTTTGKLLVVDDDPHNRKLLDTLLRAEGFTVRHAINGFAALEAVAAELPDAILLDLMMPDMDGFEVVRRLRADPVSRAVPVVMVTALDDEASRARLAAAGVDATLAKPVDRWLLKDCLEQLLAGNQP